MEVVLLPTPEDCGRVVADAVVGSVLPALARGGPVVLGLATGSSPLLAYRELLRRHVILHEYGHILLMHGGCELTLGNAFAHIGGSRRIKTLLGRSSTWTAQEIAA